MHKPVPSTGLHWAPSTYSNSGAQSIFGWLGAERGVVSCDVKLHSILLGGKKFLTKSCVSPQVFHGGMRLTGGGRKAATVRGVKPSRQCSKPGSLNSGGALESEDMVKQVNARKHRHKNRATRGWLRLGPKGTQSGWGLLT